MINVRYMTRTVQQCVNYTQKNRTIYTEMQDNKRRKYRTIYAEMQDNKRKKYRTIYAEM